MLDIPFLERSKRPGSNENPGTNAVSQGRLLCEPQIVPLLGVQAFQISNKLSTGKIRDEQLSKLGSMIKTGARANSSWDVLLRAGAGATSRSLIEQVFEYSIKKHDTDLVDLMLRVGADPNQKIYDSALEAYFSALDFALLHQLTGISNLLLDSGAVYNQMSLKNAIIQTEFNIADRMLESDPSLDLHFNYVDNLDEPTMPGLRYIQVESATILGLVCLQASYWDCHCGKETLSTDNYEIQRPSSTIIASMEYLLRRKVVITLDTMILASFGADLVALRILLQHGGIVSGFNRYGLSCLEAAAIRRDSKYDIFSLLLSSGATTHIPRTHPAFGSRPSPAHCLFMRQRSYGALGQGHRILALLISSGADINYRFKHLGSKLELDWAFQKFLWSVSSEGSTPADCIAQSKCESLLEYAIISRNAVVSSSLLSQGCQLTGREPMLAAKFGLPSVLKDLLDYGGMKFDKQSVGRVCLRLALRWSHEDTVIYLLREGVEFGEQDVIDALQYPGVSSLTAQTQIRLLRATPYPERMQVFGLPLLELCALKFTCDAVMDILHRFPAAYDSGALSAMVHRALRHYHQPTFTTDIRTIIFITDIQTMVSRRAENNCEWEKENKGLLIAATFQRSQVLRILVNPYAGCTVKTARLPKNHFSWLLDWQYSGSPYSCIDPTHGLGCQDWVTCSPLVGVAATRDSESNWSVSEERLDYLLSCSYEPDALTVMVAAAKGNLKLLRRLQLLENWRNVMSIDDHERPPWCPTALQIAVLNGQKDIVNFLLDAGTSVNELPADEPIGTLPPRTALQAAVDRGDLPLVGLLLERGACINAPAGPDSGATALQLACIRGHLAISIRLLELGADVNAKGALRHGRTAMEGAAEHGRIDTIQLLLNYGACTDGSFRDQYIKAVLFAEKNGHFAAAALLKEHREWSGEDEECYKNYREIGFDDA
jgi:ankyrin repeat protein